MKPSLYIGITSWNSELFLPVCLDSIRQTTKNYSVEVEVLDNCSVDQSQQIAETAGVKLLVKNCTQGDALNILFERSKADYTLLIHSDVVFIGDDWFTKCLQQMNDKTVLVSPEDIGCGPMSRPFGVGKPESSFMLFNTQLAKEIKQTFYEKSKWIPWFKRAERKIDFYGDHVTHNLVDQIESIGLNWINMRVLHSKNNESARHTPLAPTAIWTESLADLEYGLGNFYSFGQEITHYHNWYDRIDFKALEENPAASTARDGKGFPLSYIKQYSERFIRDYKDNNVSLPPIDQKLLKPTTL